MKLLDLFCGAGGAAEGYRRAEFSEIVGVDIHPQPHYPFDFELGDAIGFLLEGKWKSFDVIHASPPCQAYSVTRNIGGRATSYQQLIPLLRDLLIKTRKPYIIENVVGAPLVEPIMLCGTMFRLKVFRHRLFESSPKILLSPGHPCHPRGATIASYRGYSCFERADYITLCGHSFRLRDAKIAMGIDWMNQEEIAEAIPPAYSQYVGEQIKLLIQVRDKCTF